jgi:hypothetical protein
LAGFRGFGMVLSFESVVSPRYEGGSGAR